MEPWCRLIRSRALSSKTDPRLSPWPSLCRRHPSVFRVVSVTVASQRGRPPVFWACRSAPHVCRQSPAASRVSLWCSHRAAAELPRRRHVRRSPPCQPLRVPSGCPLSCRRARPMHSHPVLPRAVSSSCALADSKSPSEVRVGPYPSRGLPRYLRMSTAFGSVSPPSPKDRTQPLPRSRDMPPRRFRIGVASGSTVAGLTFDVSPPPGSPPRVASAPKDRAAASACWDASRTCSLSQRRVESLRVSCLPTSFSSRLVRRSSLDVPVVPAMSSPVPPRRYAPPSHHTEVCCPFSRRPRGLPTGPSLVPLGCPSDSSVISPWSASVKPDVIGRCMPLTELRCS